MRSTPEIRFIHDDSIQRGEEVCFPHCTDWKSFTIFFGNHGLLFPLLLLS